MNNNNFYQARHGGGESGEPPPSLLLAMLEEVDVEVDGAVEGGQQVAEAGHIGYPARPNQLSQAQGIFPSL